MIQRRAFNCNFLGWGVNKSANYFSPADDLDSGMQARESDENFSRNRDWDGFSELLCRR